MVEAGDTRLRCSFSTSLRAWKLWLNYASDWQYGSLNVAVEMLAAMYGTDEFREGMTAFLEKRKPESGRFRR